MHLPVTQCPATLAKISPTTYLNTSHELSIYGLLSLLLSGPQVHQLPPELAAAQITSQQFEHMVHLRRNMHVLSFALDFCAQVGRQQPGWHTCGLMSHVLLCIPGVAMQQLQAGQLVLVRVDSLFLLSDVDLENAAVLGFVCYVYAD
jgi:hypothetical protein